MSAVTLRAAPGARQELPRGAMVTPKRPFNYTDRVTGITETVTPGRDYFAADHEAVKRHPSMFRRVVNPMSPAGGRERIERLKAELVSLEREKRALAGGGTTRTSRPLPLRTSPWRLAEPGTRPRTGRI